MSSRYSQLKEKLPISRLSYEALLAFRVLYNDPLDIVDLEQDVLELALYPERLKESYRKEWEVYVLKAMAKALKANSHTSSAEFIESVIKQVEEIQETSDMFKKLVHHVQNAKSINQTKNAIVFPSPLRQQLMAFLLPITTVAPSHDKD